ncbi:uncharacterized protein MONBRDRAFT_37788 [Monosiga brevicollis MX1]|uniref:Protein kinase domain-containing protein n=1 Tax=Monosiga brevicollis TaxID=81824 RepID=A9V408_MONBE|nr:uncharacterized protein MONBRDRAFT_37788 [Monosiga brevicollis MX1]EDQ87899.1 predicted protein [Monosiga brevicollis MX1]|eukprot:XP_001747432.1 hypothetical protein [Monosiga brevicollis MX1]
MMLCKLADFGLSRALQNAQEYYRPSQDDHVPFRWMSPETLVGGAATMASDVWAFGVVCYEVITGLVPYAGLDMPKVVALLKNEGRLALPAGTPPGLERLVAACWQTSPDVRPTAAALSPALSAIATALSVPLADVNPALQEETRI